MYAKYICSFRETCGCVHAGSLPHPLMGWVAHASELRWVMLGMEETFKHVTSLSVDSGTADNSITMQLTGFRLLKKLSLRGHISREVLTQFGVTSPVLSRLEVSSDLTCDAAQSLHTILPALTHFTVIKMGINLSVSCVEMLSGQYLTCISIDQFELNSEIWSVLPLGLKHLTCSASRHTPLLDDATEVRPHLKSFTAVCMDVISADGLTNLLHLSPCLELVTLTQSDTLGLEGRARSCRIAQVFIKYRPTLGHASFDSIVYIDKRVSERSLQILPEGLHLHVFSTPGAGAGDGYIPGMLHGMEPLPGTTGVTLNLRYHPDEDEVIPDNLSVIFPKMSAFNLYTADMTASLQVAQLSKCKTLERVLLECEDSDYDAADLCLLCTNLPSLRVIEIRAGETDLAVTRLQQQLTHWGIATQIQRFAGAPPDLYDSDDELMAD